MLVEKGKTNWLFLAIIVIFALAAAGGLLFFANAALQEENSLLNFTQLKKPSKESAKATVQGRFFITSGCMGVVEGILLPGFANKCDEAQKYQNRIVEISGVVSIEECQTGEQCWGGPEMKEIRSIRIIQLEENPKE